MTINKPGNFSRPTYKEVIVQRKCYLFFLSFILQINFIWGASTGVQRTFTRFGDAQKHAADYAQKNPDAFVYIWKLPSGIKQTRGGHDLIGIPVGRDGSANVQIYHSLPYSYARETFVGSIPESFNNEGGKKRPPFIHTWSFRFQPNRERYAVIALKGTLGHLSFGEYADQGHYLDGNGQYFDLRKYLVAVESVGSLGYTSWREAFAGCTNLRYVKTGQYGATRNVTDMSRAFFNTQSLENIGRVVQLQDVGPVSQWFLDTRQVTNMSGMFEKSGAQQNPVMALGFTNMFTSRVTNMSRMFFQSRFAIHGSSFLEMGRVTNMSLMLRGALHMRPDVSNWDVSNVVNMSYAFGSRHNIINKMANWDTRNVKHMDGNFSYIRFPKGYVFPLDTSSMETADYLFAGAINPPIAGIETGNLRNANGMYEDATLSGDAKAFANWDLSSVKNVVKFFKNARWADQPNPIPSKYNSAYYILPYSKEFMHALFDSEVRNVNMSGQAVTCQNQPLWKDTGCLNLRNALIHSRNFQF